MKYRITMVKIYEAPTRLDALEQFEREYPGQGHYVAAIAEDYLSRELDGAQPSRFFPPTCQSCGLVMCETFTYERINARAERAIPTGAYRCYRCEPIGKTEVVVNGPDGHSHEAA